ncbi:hypothetical protein H1Q78_01255 [Cellulosimicrobium cellulans]|uniref:Acg family FMN-binding oxidoreductase n=1 Tax=Cellulosimicrobium cellulans TaxID=1710 RepID=UPI001EDAB428|nr:hypothetical protein [Cellulosimicrobium cellulans]UKJ64141.1 hypothetical protein H1Q78_01255 [Cellulosimicrobium cellulans]
MRRDAKVARIVRAGTRAPSVLNSQPWAVVDDGDDLQVRADPARWVADVDPEGREMFVSVGAFLLNLRVAAEHEGLDAAVTLFPAPDDPWLVARVTLGPAGSRTSHEPDLYPAIELRRSLRGTDSERAVDPDVLPVLRRAVRRERADVVFAGPRGKNAGPLLAGMRRAEARASQDVGVRDADRAWVGVGPERPDGVPAAVLRAGYTDPILDVHRATRDEASGARTFEGRQHLAVVTTVDDGPLSWVVAGQALERMLLVAASRDVQAAIATRALEDVGVRHEIESAYCPGARAQVLLRLAHGWTGPPTPRRGLDDVLSRPAGQAGASGTPAGPLPPGPAS